MCVCVCVCVNLCIQEYIQRERFGLGISIHLIYQFMNWLNVFFITSLSLIIWRLGLHSLNFR